MIDILLSQDLNASRIRTVLTKALEKNGIILISPYEYFKTKDDPQYLIASLDDGCKITSSNSILILGASGTCPVIQGNSSVILDSKNTNYPFFSGAENKLKAISCGLSSKDTLTLSSFTTDSAVASLQRSITTLSGNLLEPADFPLAVDSHNDTFSILASVAVFILTDNLNLISEIVF